MTNEEAVVFLKSKMDGSVDTSYEWCEVIRLAIEALEKQNADGCVGCKYGGKDEYEMPCLICKRNKVDYWRGDEDE